VFSKQKEVVMFKQFVLCLAVLALVCFVGCGLIGGKSYDEYSGYICKDLDINGDTVSFDRSGYNSQFYLTIKRVGFEVMLGADNDFKVTYVHLGKNETTLAKYGSECPQVAKYQRVFDATLPRIVDKKKELAKICNNKMWHDGSASPLIAPVPVPFFSVAVSRKSPASDNILMVNVATKLSEKGWSVQSTLFFDELESSGLDNKVVLLIQNGQAIVVVGKRSPPEHATFATYVKEVLDGMGVNNTVVPSRVIKTKNLASNFPFK
jgi:hypothetical protein